MARMRSTTRAYQISEAVLGVQTVAAVHCSLEKAYLCYGEQDVMSPDLPQRVMDGDLELGVANVS